MNMQEHILAALREQLERWEELLATLSEEQVTTPHLPSPWSLKDEIAHLWAWQQRSIARLEAAALDQEPEFPRWPADLDPEAEGDTDPVNAWIYAAYRELPWPKVRRNWAEGFVRLIELGERVSEKDLLDEGRYAWMEGRPLALVLLGTYDHHQEHLEGALAWLWQAEMSKSQ